MNTKPRTNRGKLPSLKICCYCQPADDLQGIERQEAGVRPLLDAVEMLHPEEVQSQHESRVTIPTPWHGNLQSNFGFAFEPRSTVVT